MAELDETARKLTIKLEAVYPALDRNFSMQQMLCINAHSFIKAVIGEPLGNSL